LHIRIKVQNAERIGENTAATVINFWPKPGAFFMAIMFAAALQAIGRPGSGGIVWPLSLSLVMTAASVTGTGLYFSDLAFAAQQSEEAEGTQAAQAATPKKMKVTKIYFFGYQGIDLKNIRAVMPLKEGDEIEQTTDAMKALKDGIDKAVEATTGKKTTDIAPVFFQKTWTVYIGLPGTSSHAISYKPPPTGKAELPPVLIKTYQATMDANMHALETGQAEDRATYDQLREKSRQQAQPVTEQLMVVLAESSDHLQRQVAAHCLGLVAHTQEQIDALAEACYDENSGVRNDAVRALAMLLESDSHAAKLIPIAKFVPLLSSGIWTDRNKGSFLIGQSLSQKRDPRVRETIGPESLPALQEIAGWDIGHASPALTILTALGIIPSHKADRLIEADQTEEITGTAK
jgi:hypothetical protein